MGNHRTAARKKKDGADSELHTAARIGDLRSVESICSSDPLAVNSRDKHSRTPLHLASWSGHAEIVSHLCKHKADVGASAMDGTSAIHFASQKGHVEVVRVLLSSGASVKSANRKGMTPLHFAVQGSHLELVKYLIRKGANLDTKNKAGETPLDLVNSEEMRSLFAKLVKSNEDQMRTSNVAEPPSKLTDTVDGENVHGRDSCDWSDVSIDGREKRKGEVECDDNLTDAKKRKVSLAHLVEEEDVEEEV